MKTVLRIISVMMLLAAIAFLAYALTHPEAGCVFYLFGQPIGSDVWRAVYAFYAVTMIGLFFASFFAKKRR